MTERTDNRCLPNEHDYHPLPRERRGMHVTNSNSENHDQTVTYDIEPGMLYCKRCGWFRDIPA